MPDKIRNEIIIITVLAMLLLVTLFSNFKKPEKTVDYAVNQVAAISNPLLQRQMGVLLGPAILPGNRITPLQNGDEIFPSMLNAIRSAKKTITLETYIYWSGKIGTEFSQALEERARAGVRVSVIIDWAGGNKMDDDLVDSMREAGIQLVIYHPLRWYRIDRLNNRTHRKLMIIDGNIGFVGGVGIGDEWLGHAQDPDHWRDMHFKVEGPAVAEFQSAFMDNWLKTTGTLLHGEDYFPLLSPVGDKSAHLFVSSPTGGSGSMHLMYLLAIGGARHTIDIAASYFVPDDLMRNALISARRRGVRIRVLLPDKHLDSATVRIASKREWGALLAYGVEFYVYNPTMFHSKMIILDGEMVSVGSTNFDMRSFQLNDEASLNVYDKAFAAQMTGVYENDLRSSTRFTRQMWNDRPWTQKFAEVVIRPLRSQL
ncbi:MAG: phospholipase D-like domain-containing protein [Lysobacteraceae bacterium]